MCLSPVEQKSGGKLTASRLELGEEQEEESSKKKRRLAPRAIQPKLMTRFRGADIADVEQVRF